MSTQNTDTLLKDLILRVENLEARTEERLERIEKILLASLPAAKRPARLSAAMAAQWKPDVVLQARVVEAVRQFDRCCNLGYGVKQRLGFNSAIIGAASPVVRYEIVPESILRNRCSLRKIFAPNFAQGEQTSIANVNEAFEVAIRQGLLIRSTVSECNVTKAPCFSTTSVLLSPAELKRQGGVVPAVPEPDEEEEEDAEPEPVFDLSKELRVPEEVEKVRIEKARKAQEEALVEEKPEFNFESSCKPNTISEDSSDDDEIIDDEGLEEE